VIAPADWEAGVALLDRARRLLLVAHLKPDADTVGSVLGLGQALESLGKEVTLYCADPLAGPLVTLPGAERVTTAPPTDEAWAAFDAVVTLDVSTIDRLGSVYLEAPERFTRLPVLNVDHHLTNPRFGTVDLVDPVAASTAELVTALLERMGVPLTVPVATCLLAGVLTDTLSFQTQSTTPATLRTAASLLQAGAPLAALAYRYFRQRSRGSALVWSRALGTLSFAAGGRVAWIEVSRAVLEAAGPGADGAGLSGFAANIEGVEVGFSLEEGPDGSIFAGLRSPTVDVAAVAARFGGGGHARAAGCHFPPPATLAAARDALLGAIEESLRSQVSGLRSQVSGRSLGSKT
jgi:phosphoesterase RecJ-like protein